MINRVSLNQIALRFVDVDGDADELTLMVETALNDGTHFVRCAEWQNRRVLRLSIIEDGTDTRALDHLADKIERIWFELRQSLRLASKTGAG